MKISHLLDMNSSILDVVQTNQYQDQLSFHLRLKNLLSEQGTQSENEIENDMLKNPINSLLASFNITENTDLQWSTQLIEMENEFESALFKLINEQSGDWESAIREIQTVLHEEQLISADDDLIDTEREQDFLTETIHLFQIMLAITPDWIEKIPIHQLSGLIKIGREAQQLPYYVQTTSAEMNQLEQLDQTLQQLFSRLQDMEHDQKFHQIFNHFKTALPRSDQQMGLPMYKQYMSPPMHHGVQYVNDQQNIDQISTDVKIQPSINSQHYQLHLPVENDGDVNAHTLLREFSNILSRAKFQGNLNTNRLFIKLYPEHLGTLQVELLQKNGVMTARLIASSNMAKNMLSSQLQSLKSAFSQQQIPIDRIEVSYSDLDVPKYTEQNGHNTHDQSEQHQHAKFESNDEDSLDFKDTINNILFESEA